MHIQRCVYILAALAGFGVAICRTAHADPTISANPAEVVFYTKSTTMEKSTEIEWDADGASQSPRAGYYRTNGANETLFERGGQGTKAADFIKQNNSYEFCLWGDDHRDKVKCVTVKTAFKEVK